MADDRLLPAGIRDERGRRLLALLDRFDELDLTRLLIYRVAEVEPSALPALAWQFHVMGIEGWDVAETDAERRALIRRALELHRYKGTPWAVKEAIRSAGFAGAEIQEGLPQLRYDGAEVHAGAETYGGGARWALFRVTIDLGEEKSLSAERIERLVALITAYKNARSHLHDLSFTAAVEDLFDVADDVAVTARHGAEDLLPWGRRYDGAIRYDQAVPLRHGGLYRYDGAADYDGRDEAGETHANTWDGMDLGLALDLGADEVGIDPRHDGHFTYSGFAYGAEKPLAACAAMPLAVRRHIRYDGRHDHGGIHYDGAAAHDGAYDYFAGLHYAGDIVRQEAVL